MIVTYVHSSCPADQFRVQLRCRNFADAINRVGWHTANLLDINSFIQKTPEAQNICSASDLIVIHRYLYGPVLRAVQYWKARDKKVIVDFDQAINYLAPDNFGYSFWMEGQPLGNCVSGNKNTQQIIDPLPLEQFKWGLGLVDAASVSSSRLADDWARYTRVIEIPDYLNTDHYPAMQRDHENEIWIGLCHDVRNGSFTGSGLSKALQAVCLKRPNVKLVLSDSELFHDGEISFPSSQVITYPTSLFEEWANILPKLDIGLVPLLGDYDLRTSSINLLEFMLSKIPWIATDLASFRPFSSYGTLTQNLPLDWEVAILDTVDHLSASRKKAAGEPFLFALSQDVNGNIDKILKLYTTILNQI